MEKPKFTLHFGGVFGNKGKTPKRARRLVEDFALGGPFSRKQVLNICERLKKAIQKSFKNQMVKVSAIFYPNRKCFLDIDIFLPQKQTKSPFRRTIRFPNNLMRFWKRYQEVLFLPMSKTRKEKRKEKRLEQKIRVKVEKNLERLFSILSQDKNPEKRAIAAYLLAFSKKPQGVEKYLLKALEDSEHLVHNAAGWSLVKLISRQMLGVPLEPAISLIHHPFPGCRNKGLVLLDCLLRKESRKDLLLVKRLGQQRLLEISRTNQPNYYFTKQILKKIAET